MTDAQSNELNVADVLALLANGDLDVAAITALGYAVKVRKLYDQTGNGNHLEAIALALMPVLTLNAIKSTFPAITFDPPASTGIGTGTFPATAQPCTISTVAKRIGSFTDRNAIFISSGPNGLYYEPTPAETFLVYGGNLSETPGATDNAWLALQGVLNGASSIGSVNGSSNTVNAGTGGLGGNTRFGDNSTSGLNGRAVEIGVWPVAFSSANNTAMSANQRAYWGF